ncbi:NAD-dependent epimerase/dehydratase family protein [Candidatus Omnitrophota bacterium]
MRILITGGAGMIGSHAAEHYARKGDKVTVLDNLMRSELFGYDKRSVEYNWNYLKRYRNIRLIKGDVRNKKDVFKAIGGGVDAVIHAAGQPGVQLSIDLPMDDFSINAFGTLNVLECLRKKSRKASFVFCSTNKVFGENVDRVRLIKTRTRYDFKDVRGIPEDFGIDLAAHTPYGVSKYTGDIYTQEYGHIYGMKTAAFRMSCIYGTRQFGFEDQGWVAWFVIANVLKKRITIYGDGKQVRDVLYVSDLVNAFDKFIKSPIRNAVFNMGGGSNNTMSLLEFISMLEDITGIKMKYRFSGWRASDQKVYISDISKASRMLRWKPKVDPKSGIGLLMEWVERNKKMFR